jgi:CTP:molybdopterin cytidylyltransferase MocA
MGTAVSQQQEHKLWGIVLAAGEGTRVRAFLAQLCGGCGIKQSCAIIGRRSMLEHTLARVERLIPRERILVVVSTDHREEVSAQLAHWPADVGWSDWGNAERICASLAQMGKLEDCLARLWRRQGEAALALALLKQQSTDIRMG